MKIKCKSWFACIFMAAVLSACASAPLKSPDDAISRADYAIKQAQDNEAQQYAPLPLYNAGKKVGKAKVLANQKNPTRKDYTQARQLADEAALDAELALARTKEKQAKKHAKKAQAGVQILKQELNRQESGQ